MRTPSETRVLGSRGPSLLSGAGGARGRYRKSEVPALSLIRSSGGGSSVGDCPLFDRGVVGGRDQRVLVQPGQAADVVQPVCV